MVKRILKDLVTLIPFDLQETTKYKHTKREKFRIKMSVKGGEVFGGLEPQNWKNRIHPHVDLLKHEKLFDKEEENANF